MAKLKFLKKPSALKQGDTIFLTYDQWRRLGFGVIKGQKAAKWNEQQVATFSEGQVSKIESHEYHEDMLWPDINDNWGDHD